VVGVFLFEPQLQQGLRAFFLNPILWVYCQLLGHDCWTLFTDQ